METVCMGMGEAMKWVSTFVDAVALIMALVLMVSILHRVGRRKLQNSILMGGMFSLALAFSMSDPIDLGSAGIFDMRGLLIGAGTAFFGPYVGAMTLVTGLLMRWFIGGNGMIPGFVGMVCAFAAALLWLYTLKNRDFARWKKSVVLGVLISSQMLAILIAPSHLWGTLTANLLPYTLFSNVLGSLLIGHLISGELSFLSEAETSKIEANTDHLTGLLNRRGLELVVPDLKIPTAATKGRALLCFDIDKFKSTNDNFGHAVGDQVLKDVVKRISDNLRQRDVFARLGGDEFAVILPEVDIKEARQIAERCRAIVADETFDLGSQELPISISLGALWLHQPSELDTMLRVADNALYQAKAGGRNAVVFLSKVRPNAGFDTGQPSTSLA